MKDAYEQYTYNRMVGIEDVTKGEIQFQTKKEKYRHVRNKPSEIETIPKQWFAKHVEITEPSTFMGIMKHCKSAINEIPTKAESEQVTSKERNNQSEQTDTSKQISVNTKIAKVKDEGASNLTPTSTAMNHLSNTSQVKHLITTNLEQYLADIEMDLKKQISLKAPQFFLALNQINSLHTSIASTQETIENLRVVLRGQNRPTELEVVRLRSKQESIEETLVLLERIKDLKNAQNSTRVLMGAGDYTGCVDLLDDCLKVIKEVNTNQELKCIANLETQMKELYRNTSEVMTNDLVDLVDNITKNSTSERTKSEAILRDRDTIGITTEKIDEPTLIRIQILVAGLTRVQNQHWTHKVSHKVICELKMRIRNVLSRPLETTLYAHDLNRCSPLQKTRKIRRKPKGITFDGVFDQSGLKIQ